MIERHRNAIFVYPIPYTFTTILIRNFFLLNKTYNKDKDITKEL